ncbi:MAG: metalloregulator ArsR/SmtB family transcription factor [Alphaproteobacteria bacterium]|jgi:ArsR family transcriptional regulator|nr:metalloregulator ArsR/SmtB family transcription factor [Alphaproteobacteria bacterium]
MDTLLMSLKAAAEQTRLRVLALCARGELSVTDLAAILGQSQPRVSRHLKLLADAGLLDRFREGTHAYFRLAERGPGAALGRSLVDQIPADDPTLGLDIKRLEALKAERHEAAAAYFRENAWRWDRIRSLHIDQETVDRVLVDLLPEPDLGDFLDIGAGTGRIMMLLGGRARRSVGVDLSREMLNVARANLETSSVPNWQVRRGDLYALPFGDAAFDVAVMHLVLHYLATPLAAIREAARVLRPDGRLVVADFAPHDREQLRREHAHHWLGFSDQQVEDWLDQAGFETAAPIHLPGAALTVSLWPARRKAESNVTDIAMRRPA